MKKVLAIVLSVAMLVSLFAVSSFADSSVTHVSRDQLMVDGADRAKFGGNDAVTDVDLTADVGKELKIWGWLGTTSEITGFGYAINGGEIVTGEFAVAPGQDVIDAAAAGGATASSRFAIMVPITEGSYTIEAYAILEAGSEVIWTVKVNGGQPESTSIINEADYTVSYVIDKTNAQSWSGGQIGDISVRYFFNLADDGLHVGIKADGIKDGELIQLNFNPNNKLAAVPGQFVSLKVGETLTVLQHNHKNGLLADDNAGGADITDKVANEIAKTDTGYEVKVTLPKEFFNILDVEGAENFAYGTDPLYFGMFLVAGGGGLTNQSTAPGNDWTCNGLGLTEYKLVKAADEPVPQTGDATVAMFAVLLVAAMGAAVVFSKKRAF